MTQPNQFQTWNKSSSVAPNYGTYFGRPKVDCGDEGAYGRSMQSGCATDLSPHHQNSATLLQQQLNEPLLPFSATPNNLLDYSQPPAKANHKFTLFTKLSNYHKLNAFDNLLNSAGPAADFGDIEDLSSDEKRHGMKKLLEQAMSDETKAQIALILEKIGLLSPSEKMLLYLRMPGSFTEADPLKQSQNPLGSRSEISHTINWVRSHLETDLNVSIPKQEVYEDYVAYCARINIKCLSTADFGKVMKQVFPNIRPRRLGTRGHSRYCYAAMRKATKLKPPILPDLSNKEDPMAKEMEKEESSWNVVKGWSENLLSTKFETVNELAGYITENSLNTSVNATSRSLLQKKILQREMKEKKKMNTQNMKKRRKKRKKTVSVDSNSQPDYSGLEIKRESELDTNDDPDMAENIADDLSDSGNEMLPINLTNQDQSKGENLVMNNNNNIPSLSCDTPATNLNQGLSYESPSRPTTYAEKYDDPVEEIVENIYCKKVRQAQQTKNAMALQEQPKPVNLVDPSEIQTQMLMPSKIPAKRKLKKDPYMQLKKNKYQMQTDAGQLQVEPSDLLLKKDDLKEQFILPRERFISICNMDKNSLDNYLNANEENSQDLELLQYFNDEKNNNESIEEDEDDLGPPSTSVPILENYHLFSEARKEAKNNEKISQLRSMLEQNIQSGNQNQQNSQNSMNQQHLQGESTIKNLLLNKSPSSSSDMNLYAGSASASLALMSQRHNPQIPPTQNQVKSFSNGANVPQSPNTRRKNFSFVPIPQNTQGSQNSRVKNLNMNPVFKTDQKCPNVSPFVSPRATPSFRRSTGSTMASHSNLTLLQVPSNSHPFSHSQDFKVEPVSAPPSPSMTQNFHLGSQSNHSSFQFQPLNHLDPNMAYSGESRSQSVPPNNNPYNVDFASMCSSMNPTPVPSEYADFSDSNILDIFINDTPPAIKMEDTGMLYDMMDQSSDVSSTMGMNNNFLSRSVPTTPLPYHHTYNGSTNNNCSLQNGKSVPGTPMNHTNPFRYSPDLQHARDILINGLTHNNNNNINNNNVAKFSKQIQNLNLPPIQPVPTLEEINELANFDSSNILNNL